MKKWILAAAAALLIWNIWLSVYVFQRMPSSDNGTIVVENTVNGYATDMTEAVKETEKSLVTVNMDDKEISGIIYGTEDDTVYIFTDALITSQTPSVTFDSGVSVSAQLVGTDPDTSLTLLKAEVDFKVSPVKQGSSSLLNPGEYVMAVGSRRLDTGKAMVTYGVASGEEERRVSSSGMYGALMIETDAVITGENIGGALINSSGELQGMGISHVVGGQEEMSYAVSLSEMKNVYNELVKDGAVTRGSLGITVRSVNGMESYEKSQLGISLDTDAGVIVESVYVDSPARDILLQGDIIASLDGRTVSDSSSLRTMMYSHMAGDTVTLQILRDGAESEVTVVLA